MNFLAHAYLAGHEPMFLVGNMMADFLRGRPDKALPPRVVDGIVLHRRIDAFTDEHPHFLKSRDRVKPVWGRYSPIIIDMFYDHFLAAEWPVYSAETLRDFSTRTYLVLGEHTDMMPDNMQRAVASMQAHDWFGSYASIEGIGIALERLSRRIPARRQVYLGNAITELKEHYSALQDDFRNFFPELVEFSKQNR